jgi:hypothetical protein
MADQLYLSLWYPNFRLQSLPAALTGVLRQFALIAQDGKPNSELGRVVAASSYPIDWTESPVYQRIYVNDERAEASADTEASLPENAVAEATEQMHEDSAYEFEMQWMLWLPVPANADSGPHEFKDDPDLPDPDAEPEPPRTGAWRLQPSRVRIIGFGPEFDEGSYEQNGHIRVDFGLDTPWVMEDGVVDLAAAKHIQQNVEKLLAFTLSVEKHCGISSRLLWTESGEPLAEKLIARLQRLN